MDDLIPTKVAPRYGLGRCEGVVGRYDQQQRVFDQGDRLKGRLLDRVDPDDEIQHPAVQLL
ncbi:hypothetical protein ACVWYO_004539 [Sphingomonas sp. UYP23]